MEEEKNPIEEEKYVENSEEAVNTKPESKFGWGLFVLIGGGIWAVFELIDSILFFF